MERSGIPGIRSYFFASWKDAGTIAPALLPERDVMGLLFQGFRFASRPGYFLMRLWRSNTQTENCWSFSHPQRKCYSINRIPAHQFHSKHRHQSRMAQTHEDFNRKETITGSSDRVFGLVMSCFFLIIALKPMLQKQPVRWWALAVSVILGLVSIIIPLALKPFNQLWIRLGMVLNGIVSPVVLGLLFYLVVTPIGVLMRLLGKDPLRLSFDPEADSYWIKRDPPGPPPDSLSNQF